MVHPDEPPRPRAVLFDFDFTLGDSSQGIIECVDCALRAIGRPPAPAGEVRTCIGLTLPDVLQRLSGVHAPHEIETFIAAFHRRADEVMEPSTVVFPEGVTLVKSLRERGVRTGIVSTKRRSRIEAILERRDLRPLFDTVVGIEDVPACKPDPAGLLLALRRLETDPAESLYIGDHVVDAEAAQRARVPFIGLLTGTTTRECFAARSAMSMADLAVLNEHLNIRFQPPPA
jgi:phosphoglycolate phosphatase